jgi:hypothetical protein
MRFNHSKETIRTNSLLRTTYYRPKYIERKNHPIEIHKTKDLINFPKYTNQINNITNYSKKDEGCQTIFNYCSNLIPVGNKFSNLKFLKFTTKPKLYKSKSAIDTDTWGALLSRTSSEGLNKPVHNSQTYKSSIFPNGNIYKDESEKRILKRAAFSDYNNKTQITSLPGGVKRNKYEIKENMNFRNKNNYSFYYKMSHDYDLNVNYDSPTPILQGYNVNKFPIRERYYGSYQKGVINHDIFNLKKKDEFKFPRKKLFRNNSSFKSQIEFI